MVDHSNMKLGKAPARHDKRTLHLANYLTNELKPPVHVNWSRLVTNLGVMLNDQYGCCTISALGHMIQTWSANTGPQVIVPDSEILAGYEGACGYNPDDPSTDQGGNMLDVLNYFRKTGIAEHKCYAFVAQEPGNKTHIELAVNMFGGCYLGVELPVSAQNQEVWSVPAGGSTGDGAPGSWGGHAIPIVDYGPVGPTCISWGKRITMTWRFFQTYGTEAFCVVSQDWFDKNSGQCPIGLNLKTLMDDLAVVTG